MPSPEPPERSEPPVADADERELAAYLAEHGIGELIEVFALLALWKDQERRGGRPT